MSRLRKISVLSMLVILCLLTGCFNNDLVKQREKNAGKGDNILIGVPVPLEFAKKNTNFLKGIEMAQEDINASGINGKKIKLEIVDDQGNFKKAVDIAQAFSKNVNMTAVIGHWFSDVCIPVSNIYEEAGMLTIVPTVSNPELTEKGYRYVFQSITSDKKIAREMCKYAQKKGYKKVVIYYEESSYGSNLADAIETEAKFDGLKVIDRNSGFVTEEQFKSAHDKWKALDFDAVLLAVNMPEGGSFINALRKMNQNAGIISADGLDVGEFIKSVGVNGEGVVIATTYSPSNNRPELEQFKQKYMDKYHEEPDAWAIQGYESLELVAHAIQQTNSCSPKVLADYLRNMKPWQTVSGAISFNQNGEIDGRKIYKKTVVNGQFQYIN